MPNAKYDRNKAVEYAHRYSNSRNPRYYDFSAIGGDCTNFVSQVLFAGCGVMNYSYPFGWFYRNANDRAPAWTSAAQLGRFLTENKSVGPAAVMCSEDELERGDIVQLSFDGETFTHSAAVVGIMNRTHDGILLAAHSNDCDNCPLSGYNFALARYLHVLD